MLIEAITSLTNNIGVYDLDNELKRVEININYINSIEKEQNLVIELGEDCRKIQINDSKKFFSEYTSEHFLKVINNKGIFDLDYSQLNKLLQHVSCTFSIEQIKSTKFKDASHINHIVCSLFNVLNILGYKTDRKKDAITSSAHDI